jgi:ATP-dependent DNA helicase RecG
MTRSDLRRRIANGENSGVEFKRDDLRPRTLAKELVAFANFDGGQVLLGVDDDGSVEGLRHDPDETEEWVMNVARDKIRPSLIPHFQVVRDVEPDRHVAVIRVDKGWTVHARYHNDKEEYYIRVGSEARAMRHEELERAFQRRAGLRPELRPVTGTSLEDLDRRRLRDYFTRIRGRDVPDSRTAEEEDRWRELLVNTEIMTDETEVPVGTLAGVLLFGRTPKRHLPQSGVMAVAYPGPEKEYATVEREDIRGAMVGLFSETNGRPELVDAGVVEQAMAFVRRNTRVRSEIEEGGRRIDEREYPMEAVREAIVNALVHRDYLMDATDVELSIYEDRIEVISPGRLPNTITPERMKTGTRAARNQLLKDIMSDYDYMEHRGLGVPRKIVKLMREQNGTDPDLVEEEDRFLVRLWKEPSVVRDL